MKLIFLSDIHLLDQNPEARMDNLVEIQFQKLDYIFRYASDNSAPIIQGGDFFDKARSWHLLPKMISLINKYDVEIFSVFGQHDTIYHNLSFRHETTLGVLASIGLVTVLGPDPYWISDRVHLYGCSWGEKVPVVNDTAAYNILAIHAPISDSRIFPRQQYTDASRFLTNNPDYTLVLCSDIHKSFYHRRPGGREIFNTGPLLRKTADLYNFRHKPQFYIKETSSKTVGTWHEIPHRPAEEILSREHIESDPEKIEFNLDDLTRKIKDISRENISAAYNFKDNLRALSKESPPEIIEAIEEALHEQAEQ